MKKKRITIILIIITIFLILSTVGYFIIKKMIWDYKVAHAEKIVELSTDTVFVYQSDIKIKKLIKKINGTLTTNPKIDTTKIGKQKVKFKYTTDEGYPVSYEVVINVIDITPPMIFSSKNKSITEGYDGDLSKDLFCGDNYDQHPKCVIEGDYDPTTPGTYDLTFIGEDSSGNVSTNSFTLTVKKKTNSSSSSNDYDYTYFDDIREKYQGENVHFGIDVSHWQEDIDFEKVKKAGVEFVYLRVGRGDGIGEGYVDDRKFLRNIKGFNEVGIPVGVYFYSNANGIKDAENEAKYLLEKVKEYKVDLEFVFDWENWSDFQSYDLSFYDLKEQAKAFNRVIEDAGYTGMLYSSKSYLENVWYDIHFPVWLAHYTEHTTYTGNYTVWQLTDEGYVDGIDEYVDIDIRYGDL